MSKTIPGEENAIAFVTRKALIAFTPHSRPAIVLNGTSVFIEAAIIEYETRKDSATLDIPTEFVVVGLTNGKKLTKSIHMRVNFQTVASVIELDDKDIKAIQSN